MDIYQIKEKNHSFSACLETSVKFHRYELTYWILINYHPTPPLLCSCLSYFNVEAFIFFYKMGQILMNAIQNYGRIHYILHVNIVGFP